jgi:autotransporter-associated beta strand protein
LAGGTAGNSVQLSSGTSTNNVGLGAATTALETNLFGNVSAYTLTLLSGSGFANFFGSTGGQYGAGGLITVTDTAAGVLSVGGQLGTAAISTGGTSEFWHVTVGNTLTYTDSITNAQGGIIKADGGTLAFNASQFYTGGTVINVGTLQIGFSNAILVNPTGSIPTVNALAINGVGSAFDLNGSSQVIGALSSSDALAGQAGNVITSVGSATLTTDSTTSTAFAGNVGGSTGTQAISLVKEGSATLTLTGANSYTGATSVLGGTLTLRDSGTALSTPSFAVGYGAALTVDNSGLQIIGSRISSSAPISLTGGTLNYLESQGTPAQGFNTPSFGPVTFNSGNSSINQTALNGAAAAGSFSGSASQMTLASLTQANATSTINFQATGNGNVGAPLVPTGGFAVTNDGVNAQILITGSTTSFTTNSAGTLIATGTITGLGALSDGIIGPWATADGQDWATYSSTSAGGFQGIGHLGASFSSLSDTTTNASTTVAVTTTAGLIVGLPVIGTNIPANDFITAINPVNGTITLNAAATGTGNVTLTFLPYGTYSSDAANAGVAADNISSTGSVGTIPTETINTWAIRAPGAATNMNMNGQGEVLTIATGGLLMNTAQTTVIAGGRLTAGTTSNPAMLYLNNGSTGSTAGITINSAITNNNFGGVVGLLKSGQGTGTVTLNPLPTVWTTSTTTASNSVTVTSRASLGGTLGLVVGQSVSASVGQTSGAIVTGITDATHYTLSANVGTGSTTAAGTQFNFPTTQVLSGLSLTSGSNTVTVPAGTQIFPGSSVSIGTPGSTATLAAATVVSVSGNTVTLSASFAGISATGALLFAPIGSQTVTVTNTNGSPVLALSTATGLNVGQSVTGTGVPAGAYITQIVGNNVTLSANTTAAVTSAVFAAQTASSQVVTTTSGSANATILNTAAGTSPGVFVGQPVVGAGIPQGTTVAQIIDSTHIVLSNQATASGTSNDFFAIAPAGANVAGLSIPTSGSSLSLTAAQVAGLAAGMSVNGFGISPGTVISSISGTTVNLSTATQAVAAGTTATVTFSATAGGSVNAVSTIGNTTTNTTVTLATTQGLYAGMSVSGTGIPAGTYITGIASATTVTLSNAPTSSVTNDALTITAPSTLEGYSNTYTGNTIVNSGVLAIGGVVGSTQVLGNIILNNGSLNEVTNAGQIASTSNVTINGAGTLTLVGNNTLGSITFNGVSGSTTPTVTGGTVAFSNPAAGISSTNNNLATTPTVSSAIELAGLFLSVSTTGTSSDDLILSGQITNTMGGITPAGLTKTGNGSLVLSSSTSNFNGGVNLTGGSLIFANTSTTVNGVVSAGPIGIGTLTIGAGTTVLSDGTARTVPNPVSITGNFAFGGELTGNNLILGGAVSLGTSTPTVTVTNPAVVSQLGGTVGAVTGTGAVGLTKAGSGVLVLGSAGDTWTGATTVSGGVLRFGATQLLPNSDFVVAAGAELDINNSATVIGSLSGDTATTGGLVTNIGGTATTLSVGADNSSTTFAGAFTSASAGSLNLTKIGSGTLTLTGALSNATGVMTVNGGAVTLNSTGAVAWGTDQIDSGGTLNLDDSGTNTPNRLGNKTLQLNGGTLTMTGNGSAAASETVTAFNVGSGEGVFTMNAGAGGATTFTATSLAAQVAGGGALFQGLASTTGAGLSNFVATTFNVPVGQTAVGAAGDANNQVTKAIRSDIIADASVSGSGTGFLTKDSASGVLRPLATSELSSTLTSSLTTNFGNFSATQNYSANTSVNSLTLNTAFAVTGTGGGQAGQNYGPTLLNTLTLNTLTVNTGGILATTSNTLTVGALTTSGNIQYEFHTVGAGTTLAINGYLLGTIGGLVKNDAGVLSLNNTAYYTGATTVNAGKLLLNSNAANTLAVAPTATVPTVQNLVVNGGVLDLNGFDQYVGSLANSNTIGGSGGSITSSTVANFVTDSSTGTAFGGTINGALTLYKDNSSILTLTGANTYTGATNILGGTLLLQDSGTLASGTINIDGGTLSLLNSGLANINARIASSALVNLNSGVFSVTGANNTGTNVSIGSTGAGVSLQTGSNAISLTPPATGTGNVATLNIGNITRTTGATTTFAATGLGGSFTGTGQIFLTNVNGSAITLSNGILGGWATAGATTATADNWATLAPAQTVNTVTTQGSTTVTVGSTSQMVVGQAVSGTNFAPGTTIASITGPSTFTVSLAPLATGSISTTFGNSGVVPLNSAAYTAITATGTVSGATNPTGNYSIQVNSATAVTLAAGGNTVNSLQIAPSGTTAAQVLDLGAGTLVVTTGGILRTSTNSATQTIQNGTLTAGTSGVGGELFFQLNNTTNALTAAVTIADNGVGAVTLVKTGATGVNSLLTLTGNNTYSGGTIVDTGTLTLSTAGANGTSTVAIPAGAGTNGSLTASGFSLEINNGAAVTETLLGEIAQTASVLINGGGTLTMAGTSNTLASLTFNNSLGGTGTPTVAVGTLLTLSGANAITVSDDNLASTPTISGTNLAFSNATGATNISTSGLSADDLIISAPIQTVTSTSGLNKVGPGSLVLAAANTFTNTAGLTLSNGTLILNNAAALGNAANPLNIGNASPVNTVPLTIMAGSAALTLGTNPVKVNQDFTFGGTASTNNLTIPGTVNLGAVNRNITVSSPQVTATITGAVSSTAVPTALTKQGPGILKLSSATNNLGGGGIMVAGGVLQVGNAAAIPTSSLLTIGTGTEFDVAGTANVVLQQFAGTGQITDSGAAATLIVNGTSAADVTTNQNNTFNGVITGPLALTKVGVGTLTLQGSVSNTYTGKTTVNSGTLALDNSLGQAITGSGTGTKVAGSADIQVLGGTLLWEGNNQLNTAGASTVSINLTSGQINLAGFTETIFDFTNSGGTFVTGNNAHLTANDPTWSGGTNTLSPGSVSNFGVLTISGGTNTVQGDGGTLAGGALLNVGSAGGLNFSGATSPTLTINSDATNAGQVVLQGDISAAASSNGVIAEGGSAANLGTMDLGGATRTITTATSSTLTIAVPITDIANTGNGVNKAGPGTLILSGNSTYTGATNVNAGKVVVSGKITGNVNVAAGSTLASGNNVTSQIGALNVSSLATAGSGGNASPGDAGGPGLTTIGQLNVTGSVLLGTSSTDANAAHLTMEIGGIQDGAGVGAGGPNVTNPGSLQYDRVAMTSTLTLTKVSLDITAINGYAFANPSWNNSTQQFNLDGHIFFLITGASSVATGTFTNDSGIVNQNVPGSFTTLSSNGQLFAISYDANFAAGTFTGGNDVAIMAIPEPNSMSMLAGSLGLALGLQRFRRRRNGSASK